MALRAGNDAARHCLHNNMPNKVVTLLDDLTGQLKGYDPDGSEVLAARQHLASAKKLIETVDSKDV